jgi:hypothetical protein
MKPREIKNGQVDKSVQQHSIVAMQKHCTAMKIVSEGIKIYISARDDPCSA